MDTYSPKAPEFAQAVFGVIKQFAGEISTAEMIGTLRIVAAMIEAGEAKTRIQVNIVNVVEDDQPRDDSDD
jgi:hypothetical protein